jgi:hypothetical protein
VFSALHLHDPGVIADGSDLRLGANEHVNAGLNGFAVASFVLGLLWLFWVGSILAIIFGHIGKAQIRREGGWGAGLAVAGLALGYLGVAILILSVATGAEFRLQIGREG